MAAIDGLQFEMERRIILFKPSTTMADGSQLGYNGDPNLIVNPVEPGEIDIYYCANGSRYISTDSAGNIITEWFKKAQPNGWVSLSTDSSINNTGTSSSTWQINMDASGAILQDSSSNLMIKNYAGDLTTLIVGALKIDNLTGILKAVDGSIYADASAGSLLTGTGTIIGDDFTTNYIINHNLGSLNHQTVVYETDDTQIFPEITVGNNTDTISFYSPVPSGTTYRLVIMGF
jgi:hypothetical protein